MTDPGSELDLTEEDAKDLLDAALGDLARARKKLDARADNERGTATEEAALMIAMAQAGAALSIAARLEAGAGLGRDARKVIDGLNEAVGDLSVTGNRLRNRE